MAFTSFLKKYYTSVTLSSLPRFCEKGKPRGGEDVTKVDINHEVVKSYEMYCHIWSVYTVRCLWKQQDRF